MWIAKTIECLNEYRRPLAGSVALVPTLGALHGGHMALIEKAKAVADGVIVSIFLNPAQFGPEEDYERYPQPIDRDLRMCAEADVTGVFCPWRQQIYPPNIPSCEVDIPSLSGTLEGEFRPGHFAGVCRVVLKLLNLVAPQIACFGTKDYQQWKVVEVMVADLNLPVEVVACSTVRDSDGLALSSRNEYLNATQRRSARGLFKALMEARMLVEQSAETDPKRVEDSMRHILTTHQVEVDYVALRHPATLDEMDCIEPELTGGVVALVAGRVNGVRLIDNMVMGARADQ